MNYLVSILVENHNRERLRAFRDEQSARQHVIEVADRLIRLSDAGRLRRDMFVSHATLYRIAPSGCLHVIARFDGYDGGSGQWGGWDDEGA